MIYDYLIVGAGFAGCVLAERLASQLGKRVLLIDRRPHIGGNAYDEYNEEGILVHRYGPHVFHTNDRRVFRYLSGFTSWRPYVHKARSFVEGRLVPIPINRETVNVLFGIGLSTDEEVECFFRREREHRATMENSEDVVVAAVGRRLFDLLYRGYSLKQWGLEPRDLAPSVCGRLPVRTGLLDRYFDDAIQAIPREGYTAMFARMIDHPRIHLSLATAWSEINSTSFDRLIFTGPIDEFFGELHGKLPYRSLRFEYETHDCEFLQPVAMITYPNTFPFTRTTEFKHITGQVHPKTTIAKEYPLEIGEPFYPIPRREYVEQYRLYRREAKKLATVHFVGRLATYQYYNMDQVTAQSLMVFEKIARGGAA